MKPLKIFGFVILFSVILSCNTDKPVMPNPDAQVLFTFTNTVKGDPINKSTSIHTNSSNNTYKVDLLKYYITNITLVDDKGIATNYKNYNLIDAFDINSTAFFLDKKVLNGNYKDIIFYVGVDQERNHTGAQEGALSASNGMLWNWTFGYIFFKMEGHFTSPTVTSETAYRNHLGTDSSLIKVKLPISMVVNGTDKKVNIKFDLDKVFGVTPNVIDLSVDNDRQSNLGDEIWMKKMVVNTAQAFSITKVE